MALTGMDNMVKAVFVDRDGTINRDVPYCARPADFELLPTVGRGIHLLNEWGFRVVVVTNQSGISRGYFNEETLALIHQRMRDELAREGASVDAVYYCPHHPDEGCDCRKPNIGLLRRAAADFQLDLTCCYVIGDSLKDIEAARRAGCQSVLVYGGSAAPEFKDKADFACADFYSAAVWVVTRNGIAVENSCPHKERRWR
ncbi:D-glycero-beta-D-manno-heptose 1,7-bisphosphate 7-phosphatase [Chloroflexota bacterium]